MLQELAQYLVETGKKCVKHEVIRHPTNPDAHLIVGPDGVRELETERQPPRLSIMCHSAEDFVEAYVQHSCFHQEPVWYDDTIATVHSGDTHRTCKLRVEFPAHPAVGAVLSLAGGKVFDQKALVRFLRVDLAGRVEDFVLARMRQLNWDTARKTRQALQHGSASLDSEVKASVTAGEAAAPEEFYVEVPLFADPRKEGLSLRIKLLVELEPETAKIILVLPPGTNAQIQSLRRDYVQSFLSAAFEDGMEEASDVPVFIWGESSVV